MACLRSERVEESKLKRSLQTKGTAREAKIIKSAQEQNNHRDERQMSTNITRVPPVECRESNLVVN